MNVGDLIHETQRQLFGVHRGQMNFLATELDLSTTSLALDDDIKGINSSTLLAIDDELLLVRAADPASKTVTVVRGWLGSNQAVHQTHSIVEVQPRFPKVEIRRALRDEIRSWGAGVFQVEQTDIDISAGTRTIDLAAIGSDWLYILSATRTAYTGSDADVAVRYKVQRQSLAHPYGAVVLDTPALSGTTITLAVARPFDISDNFDSDDTDLVDDVGLAESMLDIPTIGACWRLLSPREINRLDPGAQGEPRSAAEVQAGMIAAVARGYKQLRDTRLEDEAIRLRGRYPWRF